MRQTIRLLAVGAAMLMGVVIPQYAAHAATLTVNTTADAVDANPGNGTCVPAMAGITVTGDMVDAKAAVGGDGDTTAPKVISTVPKATAKGVAPGVNVTATFSEAMDPKTVVTTPTDPANPNVGTSTTFKLFKAGTTNLIGAVVTYNPTTNKAILNPNANLKLGTKYKAAVTTGAKDLAGNPLDQDQDPSNGLQQMGWSFWIKN